MATNPQFILPKMMQARFRVGIAQQGEKPGDIGKVKFRFFLARINAAHAMAQECANLANVSVHFQSGLYTVTSDRLEDLPTEPQIDLED